MKRFILPLFILALLSGCAPLGPANGDPNQEPSDPCGADVNLQTCWGAASPPGTGKHRADDKAPIPGFRRVTVTFSSTTATGTPQSVPLHVLAQGVTVSGQLAVDAQTGSPFTVYDDITTTDTLLYDLGPGVVTLRVEAARLGAPGDFLMSETKLDGVPYPLGNMTIQSAMEDQGGLTKAMYLQIVVNAPPL